MTYQAMIGHRFCLLAFVLGLLMVHTSCSPMDTHICDLSKQLDFRIMGDIEGLWRSESGDLEFHFDENGHLSAPKLGCGLGIYPLVPGDSNSFVGSKGQYYDVRFIKVELGHGSFFLAFKEGFGDGKSTITIHGRIISPDVMHVQYFYGSHILYRMRPGDEEVSTSGGDTGAAVTGTSTTHEPMTGGPSDSSTERHCRGDGYTPMR